MDSLLGSCAAAAIGFFTILVTLLLAFYRRFRSNRRNVTVASSSSTSTTLSSDFEAVPNGLRIRAVYIYCEETLQYTFASHLSVDFRRKRIAAFVNCDLNPDVAEGASASVVVFSKSYSSSASCLDKLVTVLRCRRNTGQMVVVPVFYGISPSDVAGLHRLLEEHFGKILKELPRVCSSITRPSLRGEILSKKRTLVCAFGNDIRDQKRMELSMEVIDYARGNPFALSFYGRELKGKKPSEMEATFLKLKLQRRRRLWEPWTIKFLLEDDKLEANGYPRETCKRPLNLDMLKTCKLCYSQQLTEVDDLSKAQNIELIDLQGCTKLQRFPTTGQLRHLRVVNLSGCTAITSVPEVSPNIVELHLQGTGTRELPISLVSPSQEDNLNLEKLTSLAQVISSNQHLDKLVLLNMKDCFHLQSLPHMFHLETLEVLDLSGCSELKSIQGFPRNLKELYLVGTAVTKLPPLPWSIEVLNAHGCMSLVSVPFGFERLPRYYTFSNCFALSAQEVREFVANALANIERIAREYQPELKKSLAFSFTVPSAVSKNFTCDLQPGSSVMIQLGSSWRSTLGFAVLVELSFLEDYQEATGFGITCVCRWKDKEFVSHRLEKNSHCWSPEEGVPKDHMFVFCDLNMHRSTCEGNDPGILADLVVFEFFTVNKQKKPLDESCTVKKCGVHVITAVNGDASCNMTQESFGNEVEEELRVVFDVLDKNDRTLFLYIARLFNDEKADFLTPLIPSTGLEISSRLKFLASNSLIHISPFGITMRHSLRQKISREIVHRQPTLGKDLIKDSTSPAWKYDVFISFSGEDDTNMDGVNSRKWANEANMFEKTDSDVLEKIDHKRSNESGDMVGVEEHVTDDGFGSGWESEEVDKTVGTAGFMTKGEEINASMVAMPVEPSHLFKQEGRVIRSGAWSPSFLDRIPFAELYTGEVPTAVLQGLGNIRSVLQSRRSI
ncbi:hypothetical protein HID58_000238 [Brassica napus]|uniref:TIR domain-containing protein n=1 Tax=Brassica napus TaxID=3708 RepID=A0ABQ8EG74_BRANA|nr:hypothetical protein HID58_000238 [Brassica napus]